MNRARELVTDVIAGLREQRARRRATRSPKPPRGRARVSDGSLGFRGPLVGALVLSVLGLAVSGSAVLLVATIVLAILVWAIESAGQAGSRHEIVVTQAAGVPAPAHVSGEQPAPIPADRPAPEAARRPLPDVTRKPVARGARSLDYEGTLAELMTLVGETVIVDVAPAERGGSGAASRMSGTLAAGSVDDGAAAGRSGRGLYFGVGEGSGFFLPALDFMGARRAGDELAIRLRGYTVTVRGEVAAEAMRPTVSAS